MGSKITMGSLFSGSGGFELAGQMAGIVPVWASEIEPFPLLVTKKRFPDMLHLGDIKKMDGGKIPKVEIITGGSPCQDMSIAGKREGLDGSRSNLFREQIRIVKEMRESDRASGRRGIEVRPRYMVWENVPGAFSSNKGEDFRCVLEEICRVADAEVSIPRPPKNKWSNSGTIMGDGYSVAWRTLDAQYWGVPQRRKRIYLVADFGGESAPQILFKQDSMRGNFKESIEEREGTPGSPENGTNKSDRANVDCFDISDRRSVVHQSINSPTLTQKMGTGGNNVPIIIENHSQDCRWSIREDGTFQTLLTGQMGTGGNNVPMLIDSVPVTMQIRSGCDGGGKGPLIQINKSATLTQAQTQTLFIPNTLKEVIPVMDKASRYKSQKTANGLGIGNEGDPAYTLTTADKHSVAYSIDRAAFNQGANAKYDISIQKDLAQTLVAKGPSAVMHESFAMQGFGEYKSSNVASSLKQRDSKDATDLVVAFKPGTVSRIGGHFYEDGKTGTLRADPGDNQQAVICNDDIKYIIRRLTPTECGRLQGFPDGWADSLETENITADDIDYWKLIFQQHTESLVIVKKDKTDNQIKKWLSNPESDTAKYKMWGNGIALPCAAFVMEGIAHELQRRSMKEITINVPDGTQLLHVLAVIDKGKEIHYEAKFCDLRDGKLEYTLDSCNKEGE